MTILLCRLQYSDQEVSRANSRKTVYLLQHCGQVNRAFCLCLQNKNQCKLSQQGQGLFKCSEASNTYQTECAIFSSQQVGQQTRQGGLVTPAPAGCVEVGWNRQVDVRQEASEETESQRYKATQRQLLFKYKDKMFLNSCCPNREQESKMERVCVNKTGEPCLVMLFPKSPFFLRPAVTLKLR